MKKQRVYVKPVNEGALFGWIALKLTIWQNFFDDRQRYGWRIALYNLWTNIAAAIREGE